MIGRQSRLSCFTLSRNPMQAIRIHQFGPHETKTSATMLASQTEQVDGSDFYLAGE